MRWRGMAAAALAIGLATAARADEKKLEPPKPGPEVEKLGYFVGGWTSAGEMKESPMGPAGPTSGRDMCGWLPGKFFVVCRIESKGPMGTVAAQGIIGYDTEKKVYTWWSFNSLGQVETATGRNENGSWIWSNEMKMGGKTMKGRYTMSDTTPAGYDFKWEDSSDGKTWNAMLQGKVSKIQRAERGAPPAAQTTPAKP